MKRKKILAVVGTRPETIKMAPVVRRLKSDGFFNLRFCATGQHREMLDQATGLFGLKPDYSIDIMRQSQPLDHITASVVTGVGRVLEDFVPDLVLVHGDTATTFASALAAFYKKIPVGHVEAGLRTGDIYAPWPEEANRKLTAQLAGYHFAPTELNRKNLLSENIPAGDILVTGNTVIDALQSVVGDIASDSRREAELRGFFEKRLGRRFSDMKYVLITGHRRENFGKGFENICSAVRRLARRNKGVDFIYPVHLNPNVQRPVNKMLSGLPNVHLISPLDYLKFVYLMSRAYLVLTDSGGIQEEAPGLGKPVLVMREVTERPEGIAAGTVRLVGSDGAKIASSVQLLLDSEREYRKMAGAANPYGDGHAAERIRKFLRARLGGKS